MEVLHGRLFDNHPMKKGLMNIEYAGSIPSLLSKKIYLNVSYLKKGVYEIHILCKGKTIKKTPFTRS
jgi:hypothetical protein